MNNKTSADSKKQARLNRDKIALAKIHEDQTSLNNMLKKLNSIAPNGKRFSECTFNDFKLMGAFNPIPTFH